MYLTNKTRKAPQNERVNRKVPTLSIMFLEVDPVGVGWWGEPQRCIAFFYRIGNRNSNSFHLSFIAATSFSPGVYLRVEFKSFEYISFLSFGLKKKIFFKFLNVSVTWIVYLKKFEQIIYYTLLNRNSLPLRHVFAKLLINWSLEITIVVPVGDISSSLKCLYLLAVNRDHSNNIISARINANGGGRKQIE